MTTRSKNLLLLSFLAIFCSGISERLIVSAAQPSDEQHNTVSSTDEEQRRAKTELEIKKLQKEINSITIGPWLQLGTVAIALLAASISFWSAWKSQRSQTRTLEIQINQQQKSMISGLLKDLGSENQGVKIAAIQALSEYQETHPFLLNLLKYERDAHVVDSIIIALEKNPEYSLPLLISASNSIYGQKLTLACELHCSGLSKVETVTLLKIENAFFSKWLDTSRGKRVAAFFEGKVGYLVAGSKTTEAELLEKEKARILMEWYEADCTYNNVIKAIESVVGKASSSGLHLTLKDAHLQGAIFDKLNLGGWIFTNCDLRDACFREANCNGSDFSNSTLDRANFRSASLHDAIFDHSSCKHASFDKAKLVRSSLKSFQAYGASFFNTRIKKADFAGAHLVQTNFEKATGEKVNFTGAAMMGCILKGSLINDSDLARVDLSGADLSDMEARRAKFIDCKLAGANLLRADFRWAEFTRTTFIAIKQFSSSRFAGAVMNDLRFDDESEEFSKYLAGKLAEDLEKSGEDGQPTK